MRLERDRYGSEDYLVAAKWEGRVEFVCCRINEWELIKRGKGTRVSHKFARFGEPETGFDFLFKLPTGVRIWIEVTGDRQYTWEESKFFPIQPLKVERAKGLTEETLVVYYLDKDDSCFWLSLKTCGEFPIENIRTKKGPQIKHLVPKETWHRSPGSIKGNWKLSIHSLCMRANGVREGVVPLEAF